MSSLKLKTSKIQTNLYVVLFLTLLCNLTFAQQTYKITEGELQFINPEEGIFIKKNNTLFRLSLGDISDYGEFSKGFKYELENTTIEALEKIKKDTSTIFSFDIVKNNFDKLNTTKFITKQVNDDIYQLVKYNKDFFSIGILKGPLRKPGNEYLLHFCILDFGFGKKIIYHSMGYIVPTEKKINFLFNDFRLNLAFQKYESCGYKSLKAVEIHSTKGDELELNRDFYKIDTLKNKKLRIINNYNQVVIKKTFDSIKYNSFFIVSYINKKISIYNYTFQKLDLTNIRAFYFNKFYPCLEIIENNKLKRINLVGKEFRPGNDLSFQIGFDHYFPNNKVAFKIVKENDVFYIQSNEIGSIVPQNFSLKNKVQLKNSDEFESVEFLDQDAYITLYSEMMNYSAEYPILIYTKLKTGKFNLNTIEYLISENPTKEIEDKNNRLPKNLDKIEKSYFDSYLIEKNGLVTYYPITKEIKYKSLGKFQDNFARFELPNGQKGWLSKDGKEYFDE